MWRGTLLVAGALVFLLGLGMFRIEVSPINDRPGLLLPITAALWFLAVRGWNLDRALFGLGFTIIGVGLAVFFGLPVLVNAGSGQDAVALFAVAFGAMAGLIGLTFIALGAISTATKRRNEEMGGRKV